MFEDDVYDRINPDDRFFVMIALGGWQIADHERTERFKALFTNQEHANEICKQLNEDAAEIRRLEALVETYKLNWDPDHK